MEVRDAKCGYLASCTYPLLLNGMLLDPLSSGPRLDRNWSSSRPRLILWWDELPECKRNCRYIAQISPLSPCSNYFCKQSISNSFNTTTQGRVLHIVSKCLEHRWEPRCRRQMRGLLSTSHHLIAGFCVILTPAHIIGVMLMNSNPNGSGMLARNLIKKARYFHVLQV